MKFTTNKDGQKQAIFSSELATISDSVLENTNNKKYKIVGLKFKDANGTPQKATGIIYEGNYNKGIEIGKDYLTTATLTDKGVFLQMSHLENIDGRANADMFNFEAVTVDAKTGEIVVETKQS